MNQAQWMTAAIRKLLKLAGVLAVVVASCVGSSASIQAGVGESSDGNAVGHHPDLPVPANSHRGAGRDARHLDQPG